MEMAEMRKKRLSINLSFLSLPKQTNPNKSTKNFHAPNGVVGLGILAALNDDHDNHDLIYVKGRSRTSFLPKSQSIRDCKKDSCGKQMSVEDMELCEEYYTCVISHVGENLIEKREYFEVDLLEKKDNESEADVGIAGFLHSCFLCDKLLHGLDIFMYRGEKAFCSAECRYQQISIDEQKEKRRSGVRKPKDLSVSPCTGTLQFFAGIVAA